MSSKILKKSDEVELLSNWIHRNGIVDYNLIYRGSEDGYLAEDFHRCCDNATPIFLIIEAIVAAALEDLQRPSLDLSRISLYHFRIY